MALKIGLIGCGQVAINRHLPALLSIPDAEVVAATDIDPQRLEMISTRFGISRLFTEYRHMLSEPDMKAIAVLTPLHTHFEVASSVLESGRHLLIEKPLTTTLQEADKLLEQAAFSTQTVMIGFNRRWHRLILRAVRMIRKGHLGPLQMVNVIYSCGQDHQKAPYWRKDRDQGGGSLMENAPHIFDLWRLLIQDEIEEVFAFTGIDSVISDEPVAVCARSQNGVLLNASISDLLPNRNEIEIFGQQCALRISLHRFDGFEFTHLGSCAGDARNRLKQLVRSFKELPQGVRQYRHGGDYTASFRTQWLQFIESVRNNTPAPCGLEDGRQALLGALAAVQSADTGLPVRLESLSDSIPPETNPKSTLR